MSPRCVSICDCMLAIVSFCAATSVSMVPTRPASAPRSERSSISILLCSRSTSTITDLATRGLGSTVTPSSDLPQPASMSEFQSRGGGEVVGAVRWCGGGVVGWCGGGGQGQPVAIGPDASAPAVALALAVVVVVVAAAAAASARSARRRSWSPWHIIDPPHLDHRHSRPRPPPPSPASRRRGPQRPPWVRTRSATSASDND